MAATTLLSTITMSEMTDLVMKKIEMVSGLVKPNAKRLFIMDPMAGNSGSTKRYDEIDVETFASNKPEGTDSVKTQVGMGYNITGTLKRIAKEIEVTIEDRTQNRFPQVQSKLTSLTSFCDQRIELDLTHRLTFGTSTSYTDMDGATVSTVVGDGLELFKSTHLCKFDSNTWSNRVSGDPVFSQGGLEAAETLGVTNIVNNFNQKRTMKFNAIFSSPDPNTCREIRKLLQSTADIDTSNSGVTNTHKGEYEHIVLDYLATTAAGAYDSTKRKWWGIAAIGQGVQGWQAYYGESEAPNYRYPSAGNNGEDFHNFNWCYATTAEYLIAILTGRGIIASCPSS